MNIDKKLGNKQLPVREDGRHGDTGQVGAQAGAEGPERRDGAELVHNSEEGDLIAGLERG